jgi:trk/ktr system potassium uptake protein
VEVQIDGDSPSAGKRVERLSLPDGARLISVMRGGRAEIAVGSTELHAGDQVLAILEPGKEDELRKVLLKG